MRIRIQDPKNVHTDPDPRGVNSKEEKLHHQILNLFIQSDIKKSLKINKQNIYLGIPKGSLHLFFQFCIHLMNLYIF